MGTKLRRDKIMEILGNQGYSTVKQLCEMLHYSSATINRDLNDLSRRGLVIRSYGGVELVDTEYIPAVFRVHKMRSEKRQISKMAASYVNDGETIFIDGSTTAQYMEPYLIEKKSLTVITNNIVLALNLSQQGVNVVCLGGSVVEPPGMLFGTETVENARKYRVDKMFFSTQGITFDGKIAANVCELLFKTVAVNAGEIFYLVDHKKIDGHFDKIYGDLSCVNYVISDYRFSEKTISKYKTTQFVTVETTLE